MSSKKKKVDSATEFYAELEKLSPFEIHINDGTSILKFKVVKNIDVLHLDVAMKFTFEKFSTYVTFIGVEHEEMAQIAYVVISKSKLEEDLLVFLKQKFEKFNLNSIIGPLDKDIFLSCQNVFCGIKYSSSWFHIRQIMKDIWMRKKLNLNGNEILNMALALPLLKEEKIFEGAATILANVKNESEQNFCNEIMALSTTLSSQICVLNKKIERHSSILESTEKQYLFLKKCKTPNDLIECLQKLEGKLIAVKSRSEISAKMKKTISKYTIQPEKLSVEESLTILSHETLKFGKFPKWRQVGAKRNRKDSEDAESSSDRSEQSLAKKNVQSWKQRDLFVILVDKWVFQDDAGTEVKFRCKILI
ncbi:uncharacterized protein LOC127281706 isoform X2 [Leptopilina boulardi]|uniref:uncharacterized protein LOC127281706 isoform X2 n=1 Tax=Leptopilina boulardi TaxID=63433 RepID=UPI0021F65E5F|nr:uncharacterized protein LOC127281706 isoform X2 [Leptopilina boulardi]